MTINKHWIALALAGSTAIAAHIGNISIAVICVIGIVSIELDNPHD